MIKSGQGGIAQLFADLQCGHRGGAQKLLGVGQFLLCDIAGEGGAGIFLKQNRKPGVGIGRGLGQFFQ